MIHAKKILPFLFLLLFSTTLWAPPALAQEDDEQNAPGLTLSAKAGFDGLYKSQFWLPVQINVANNGPAVEGEIRIVTGSTISNDELVYTAPVSLPTQSNKRITLFIAVNSGTTAYTVDLVDEDGNGVARTRTNTLSMQGFDELIYGVVSPDPGELTFLENVSGKRSDAAVAFLDVTDLPTVPAAWNALDVLIFNDVDSGELTADQLTALKAWVSTGGQLVITGGPGWQKTTAAFGDILPVNLNGSESADDLPALSGAIGLPFRDAGPYLLAASSLRSGEMVYHEEGLPILAWHSWGRGAVHFLALDPKLAPLLDWDGSETLFNEIVQHVPDLPLWAVGIQNGYSAGTAVGSLPSLALPSAGTLMVFLLIYVLAIGPVNYMVLKRLNRRELAWVSIPVLVLFFTITAYITGFQLKGNNIIINQMNVAYGQVGGEQLRVQSLVGLYSPRRASYDLIFPADTAARPFSREFGTMSGSGNLDAISRSNNLVMTNVLVDVSDVESFVAESYRPAPEVTAVAQMNISGSAVQLAITTQNNSAFTLEHVSALIGTQVFSLGTMAPGATKSDNFTVSRTSLATPSTGGAAFGFGPSFGPGSSFPLTDNADTILGTSNYWDDPIAFPRMQLLEALDARYYGGNAVGVIPSDVLTLIFWSDEAQLDVSLQDKEYDRLQTTLYFLEVPLARNLAGGNDVSVPLALLDWEVRVNSGDVYQPNVNNLYLPSDGWVEFEFTPWEEFQRMEVTELSIHLLALDSSSGPTAPIIRLWDWQREVLVDIEHVNWGETAVTDFQPYLGPQNAIRLYIRDNSQFGVNISEIYPILTGNLE
jgi:hypothetical protein